MNLQSASALPTRTEPARQPAIPNDYRAQLESDGALTSVSSKGVRSFAIFGAGPGMLSHQVVPRPVAS